MSLLSASASAKAEPAADPPIRLMIVDDSTVARAVLQRMIAAMPGHEVVATAASAAEAIERLGATRVDIILLDVEMPGGSGLEALPDIIRAGRGAHVLIVSSMAEDGAEVTVRALAQGAVDTLPKPGAGAFAGRFADLLAERLLRIGRAPAARSDLEVPDCGCIRLRPMGEGPVDCIALAASTGGLRALLEFLRALPEEVDAPILVTQHLPPVFMSHFARQLESAGGRPAVVAGEGDRLIPGRIHVAPGDAHLCLARLGGAVAVKLDRRRSPSGCLPSADPMLASVAEHHGPAAIGVVLSGMGRDGAVGGRRLVELGGTLLAQDPRTSVIWGMPRAVAQAGLAAAVEPPRALARRVAQRVEAAPWR